MSLGGIEAPGEYGNAFGGGNDELLKLLEADKTLDHFNRRIRAAAGMCAERWKVASENNRFVSPEAGAQWDPREYKARQRDGRFTYSINDVALAVGAVTGQEITGRFQRSFKGRSDDRDHRVAEALNRADAKVRELALAEHVESNAFRSLVIEGYAWVEWYQDHLVDFRGRTLVKSHDLWNCLWDPTAREPMLSDREWDAVGWWISLDHCLALFPGKRKELLDHLAQPDGWVKDGGAAWNTQRWPWLYRAGSGTYFDHKKREVFLVDYQWRQREPMWAVEEQNPMTGASTWKTFGKEDFDAYAEAHKQANQGQAPDSLGPEDGLYRWAYRRAHIVGDLVLSEKAIPEGMYTRICMTGFPYKQQEVVTFHGIVDYMKDPQRFKNTVVSLMTAMLQRSLKGGIFYDPKYLERPADLAKDMAQPYPMIATKPGGLAQRVWEAIPVATFPSGLDQFISLSDTAVWRPIGLNPNTLGQISDPRRVSGVVLDSMKEAGSTVLSYLTNTLKLMRQLSGRLQLAIYRTRYEPDQLVALIGADLADVLPPKEEWETFFERDVVVDEEEATTKDERMRQWDLMSRQGTAEKFVTGGFMPAKFIAKLMPGLSEAERAEWEAWLDQKENLAALQQQLQVVQTQMQLMQAEQQLQMAQQGQQPPQDPNAGGQPADPNAPQQAPPEQQPQ